MAPCPDFSCRSLLQGKLLDSATTPKCTEMQRRPYLWLGPATSQCEGGKHRRPISRVLLSAGSTREGAVCQHGVNLYWPVLGKHCRRTSSQAKRAAESSTREEGRLQSALCALRREAMDNGEWSLLGCCPITLRFKCKDC